MLRCTCCGIRVLSFNLLQYLMMKFLFCGYNCMDFLFMFPSNLLNFSTHFLIKVLNIFSHSLIAVSTTCCCHIYQVVKCKSESNNTL